MDQSFTCDYFDRGQCRSCTLLETSPAERLSLKRARFEQSARAALDQSVPIAPLWQPEAARGSRTKVKVSVSGTMSEPIVGLVDRRLASVELLDCPLHLSRLNEVLHALKRIIPACKLAPYHIERRQGELKGFILKANEDASQVLVRFVVRSRESLSKVKRAARELRAQLPFVTVVSANIQPLPAAVLEGEEEIHCAGERVIWERFGQVKLAFGPQSFAQVTHTTAEALYLHVASRLRAERARSLLDLFCGVGGFSLVASGDLEWGAGVELSPQAIEYARLSAESQGRAQLRFESGDVEAFLKGYSGPRPDALLFNPPRRGLSPAIIESALKLGSGLVLYSSCNPETLLRDLAALGRRYEIAELAPFDMFPMTEHLEVVATLKRKQA